MSIRMAGFRASSHPAVERVVVEIDMCDRASPAKTARFRQPAQSTPAALSVAPAGCSVERRLRQRAGTVLVCCRQCIIFTDASPMLRRV
jgi:hypothetical protein